jgi:ribonuclease P protein component
MRAMFCEFSNSLKDGTYVFVAKVGIFETSHEKLHNDFKKILSRAQTISA